MLGDYWIYIASTAVDVKKIKNYKELKIKEDLSEQSFHTFVTFAMQVHICWALFQHLFVLRLMAVCGNQSMFSNAAQLLFHRVVFIINCCSICRHL